MNFMIKGLVVVGAILLLILYFKWSRVKKERKEALHEIAKLQEDLGDDAAKAVELADERIRKVKISRLAELYLTEHSYFDKRKRKI